jgi:uncharacterized membrane protein YbhN (UPF0104 family)
MTRASPDDGRPNSSRVRPRAGERATDGDDRARFARDDRHSRPASADGQSASASGDGQASSEAGDGHARTTTSDGHVQTSPGDGHARTTTGNGAVRTTSGNGQRSLPPSGGGGDGRGGGRITGLLDSARGLYGLFALSWLIAIALIVQLIRAGGFYQVAANTRVLDFLGRAGIIQLTNTDIGSFLGSVTDSKYFVQSNDYIDWIVVGVAVVVFVLVWALKAAQFHSLARYCGVRGTFDQHARAYFYGHGINRIFPFNMGNVASAAVLEGQGVPLERGSQVVYLAQLFLAFEIVVFAGYGLLALGYTKWLSEIGWPVAFLTGAYLLTRARRGSQGPTLRHHAAYARQAISALTRDRWLVTKLAAMSIVAFFGVEMTVYLITQAFTTTYVILNIQFDVIVMAVVGGYLARFIIVTPGGLGQWEWGFALPLYIGGMGMPEAASAALLMTGVRYMTGGLFFALMMLVKGVETNLARVMKIFRGEAVVRPEPTPQPETLEA